MARLRDTYTQVAIIFFNIFLLFCLLNIFLSFLRGSDSDSELHANHDVLKRSDLKLRSIGVLGKYSFDDIRRVNSDLTDRQLVTLALESSNRFMVCDPITGFREVPFNGNYYQVDRAGFRRLPKRDQGRWPPSQKATNVFIFGGSTTFGWGVPEGQTIASHLQAIMRDEYPGKKKLNVYNFGNSSFLSTNERQRFIELVSQGYAPDVAIFVDGLNEFILPAENNRLSQGQCDPGQQFLEKLRNTLSCSDDEFCLPLQRLVSDFEGRDRSRSVEAPSHTVVTKPDSAISQIIIDRWLENKRVIEEVAEQHDIQTVFVMQPVPFYRYDVSNHLFLDASHKSSEMWSKAEAGYALWDRLYRESAPNIWTRNTLNMAELGGKELGPIYVDEIHYAGAFMRKIAQEIVSQSKARSLIHLD